MLAGTLLLTAALWGATPSSTHAESAGDPTIEMCQVASIESQDVPGADSGALSKMLVKEGDIVRKDAEIARIDDREARAMMSVKQLDYEVAKQEADSEVVVRLAKETTAVAEQGYLKVKAVNSKTKNVITEIEVLTKELEWKKAQLQTEKAIEDHLSAELTAKAKQAEVDAARVTVERRILRAPFDGVVVRVYRHIGEWISPGEPVVQIVRVDRLRVTGNLDASKWGPSDVEGRKVTVEVELPLGRTEKVQGKVVFVSPVVALGHELPIWAEIESPMEGKRPLIRAGLKAKMTIHTGQMAEADPVPAAATAAPAGAPRKSVGKK